MSLRGLGGKFSGHGDRNLAFLNSKVDESPETFSGGSYRDKYLPWCHRNLGLLGQGTRSQSLARIVARVARLGEPRGRFL
jgi:hypothetical protein